MQGLTPTVEQMPAASIPLQVGQAIAGRWVILEVLVGDDGAGYRVGLAADQEFPGQTAAVLLMTSQVASSSPLPSATALPGLVPSLVTRLTLPGGVCDVRALPGNSTAIEAATTLSREARAALLLEAVAALDACPGWSLFGPGRLRVTGQGAQARLWALPVPAVASNGADARWLANAVASLLFGVPMSATSDEVRARVPDVVGTCLAPLLDASGPVEGLDLEVWAAVLGVSQGALRPPVPQVRAPASDARLAALQQRRSMADRQLKLGRAILAGVALLVVALAFFW